MDALSAASIWEEGVDGRGVTCWRNKVTGQVVYADPKRVGLAVGPSPNAHQFVDFFSKPGSTKSEWDEYTDATSKNKYWHNRVTKETTWKDPKPVAKKQQPPPPKPEKSEHEQWFRVDDPKKGKVWYNEKTEKFQIDRPDCRKKYR